MSRVDLSSAIAQSNKEVDRFAQWEQEQKDKQPIHRKILNALVFWTDLDSVDG